METDAHTSSRTRVPLPRPLDLQSVNLKSSWEKFKQVWDSYEIITGLDKDSDRVRIAHFITAVGHDALDVHNGLPYKTEDEKKDFTVILNLWEKYCVGKTNIMNDISLIVVFSKMRRSTVTMCACGNWL